MMSRCQSTFHRLHATGLLNNLVIWTCGNKMVHEVKEANYAHTEGQRNKYVL